MRIIRHSRGILHRGGNSNSIDQKNEASEKSDPLQTVAKRGGGIIANSRGNRKLFGGE